MATSRYWIIYIPILTIGISKGFSLIIRESFTWRDTLTGFHLEWAGDELLKITSSPFLINAMTAQFFIYLYEKVHFLM